MNNPRRMRQLCLALAMGAPLLFNAEIATAQGNSPKELSASWQQWALSIPTPVNPQLDTTGANCMVGQNGPIWFLAGVFGGSSEPITRDCSIPSDKALFFPVANAVNINTPGVCGQVGELSVRDLRAASADAMSAVTDFSVELDGESVNKLVKSIRSEAFATVLPEDNVFDAPCQGAGLGNVPAGIYSPSVDQGLYVKIDNLKPGSHTLHISANGPSPQDVTYHLDVVPVSLGKPGMQTGDEE
jgi:hypothetical protein